MESVIEMASAFKFLTAARTKLELTQGRRLAGISWSVGGRYLPFCFIDFFVFFFFVLEVSLSLFLSSLGRIKLM